MQPTIKWKSQLFAVNEVKYEQVPVVIATEFDLQQIIVKLDVDSYSNKDGR